MDTEPFALISDFGLTAGYGDVDVIDVEVNKGE